jgi:hypothetical protein
MARAPRPLLALLIGLAASAAQAATITIVNANNPGQGFNDTTAATPVGGNTGTTVGQQRLIAFQHAAQIWGAHLTSNVEILVRSSFEELECDATTAVLGSAGPIQVFSDHANAPLTGTWYAVALANKQAGSDQAPPSQGSSDDIRARFNSNIGTSGCLSTSGWYYGLDGNNGGNVDLVDVLLHEFGHGLGFLSLVDDETGEIFFEQPDVWTYFLYDGSTRRRWLDMSPAERQFSAINFRRVSWRGPSATASTPLFLQPGSPALRVLTPAAIADKLVASTASFGPALTTTGVTGILVPATDASDTIGPSTTDGCAPFTNAAAVAGRVALIDRGNCDFVVKVRNAQAAGAIGAVIANHRNDGDGDGVPDTNGVADMGGTDLTITIPSVGVSFHEGAELRVYSGAGVTVTLLADPTVRVGADAQGHPLLFTPSPVDPGSSVSHWDRSTFPNTLMEPNISSDIDGELDLTLPLFEDIGWGASPDADADGVANAIDNCPGLANPLQEDTNFNSIGDACEGRRLPIDRNRSTTIVSPR